MTSTRKLASALCLALCFSSYSSAQTLTGQLDPTQVYTTGNIVQPTVSGTGTTPWVNGVYQDSLTCWAWGNPGYCGPNAIVRPGDNINFSFGMTDLYQVQNIANVLPNSGSGLRVNGYNFSFMAKNGNGWDDGRTDYLTAYVRFYGSTGQIVENYNYNLNYKFDWTAFNYTQDFASPRVASSLSTVQYGFVGMDNNYWAGPYGPEIYNVSFSLRYSVDPCSVNPLSSPSCPGWADAIARINATATAGLDTTSPTNSTPSTIMTSTPVTATAVTMEPITTSSGISATASIPGVSIGSTVSSVTNVTNQTGTNTLSTASVLAGIRRQEELNQSTALSTVQRSISASIEAGMTAATQAQQQAAQSQQDSIRSSEVQAQASADASRSLISSAVSGNVAAATSLGAGQNISSLALPGVSASQDPGSRSMLGSNQGITVDTSLLSDTPVAALTRPGDPTQSARLGMSNMMSSNEQPISGPSVRNVAPPTQLAGGADYATFVRTSADFSAYLGRTIMDAAGYQPREIYANQRPIDNQRTQRLLSSANDRLHQEMVDQQYRKGGQ